MLYLINGEDGHEAPGKDNIISLQYLIAFSSENDGVLMPASASKFEFYDKNENLLKMEQTPEYIKDSYGLRTLNENNKLIIKEANNYTHT